MPKQHEGLKKVSIWLRYDESSVPRSPMFDEYGMPARQPDVVFLEADMIGVTLGESGSVQIVQKGVEQGDVVVRFYPGHMNAYVELLDTEKKVQLADKRIV